MNVDHFHGFFYLLFVCACVGWRRTSLSMCVAILHVMSQTSCGRTWWQRCVMWKKDCPWVRGRCVCVVCGWVFVYCEWMSILYIYICMCLARLESITPSIVLHISLSFSLFSFFVVVRYWKHFISSLIHFATSSLFVVCDFSLSLILAANQTRIINTCLRKMHEKVSIIWVCHCMCLCVGQCRVHFSALRRMSGAHVEYWFYVLYLSCQPQFFVQYSLANLFRLSSCVCLLLLWRCCMSSFMHCFSACSNARLQTCSVCNRIYVCRHCC